MKTVAKWRSERLGRDVQLVRWGTFGQPVLVFPTAGGDAEEIERMHLVGAVAPLIEAGKIKVYSCDSVAGKALVSREGSARHQICRPIAFSAGTTSKPLASLESASAELE